MRTPTVPKIRCIIRLDMPKLSIPKATQKIFWSRDPSQLNRNEHIEYIVHQVLQYGDVSNFKWL